MAIGAFTPLFRSHGEFPHRETPIIAANDPATMQGPTYHHRLRYLLLPCIYTVAAGTHFYDGTIMRPPIMDFEADRRSWNIGDQYLFGPALLLAPVTEFEAHERMPLFVRAGSIVPTGPVFERPSIRQLNYAGRGLTVALADPCPNAPRLRPPRGDGRGPASRCR